jgi:hypothetical protein
MIHIIHYMAHNHTSKEICNSQFHIRYRLSIIDNSERYCIPDILRGRVYIFVMDP